MGIGPLYSRSSALIQTTKLKPDGLDAISKNMDVDLVGSPAEDWTTNILGQTSQSLSIFPLNIRSNITKSFLSFH